MKKQKKSKWSEVHISTIFFKDPNKSTEDVAKELLGCLLVKEVNGKITSGWIVETEAYVGIEDQASHSYDGKHTPRMQVMYDEAGIIYIYQMHTHYMLNIVTREKGDPQAVLIRAIEPFEGKDLMEKRRGRTGFELTNGPGKLTKALGITRDDYETDSLTPPLFIDPTKRKFPKVVETSKRIGIPNKGKWTDALLRYTVKGNPYVSRKKGKVSVDNGWATAFN
ncbi:DNA-3-methyladenine glycosylase [Alkalibacterium iburiense]|uniref:Putative 3-methyladenine DNA glycosylase n=1 Tax=Alkalibacterium iburiense TaxID=290589 RepID=A0ABN0X272_9LACT